MKNKNVKRSLLMSGIAFLICIAMLVGTTFAWFTDSVTSSSNIIKSGNLDLEMYWTDDLSSGTWYNVENPANNTIFSYDNWEPGYTDVKYIKIKNNGNLAFNYKLSIDPVSGVGELAKVINVFYAKDKNGVPVNSREDLNNLSCIGLLNNVLNGGATANGTLLPNGETGIIHDSGETIVTLAMNMITTAGNEYQGKDAGEFTITALATQAPFEEDSFGKDYDNNAEYPTIITGSTASAPVTPVNNKVPAGGVTLSGEGISATVPEGVLLEPGTNKLTLKVTPLKNTTSEITPVNNEVLIPVDIHIDGIDENNTVPIIIDLGAVMPKYLNMGNYYLFHVENGVPNPMTLVDSATGLTAHNNFTYNADTGELSVSMASFSEVTLVFDKANPWQGGEDYDWYNAEKTSLNIINADQLYAFAKIVGGKATNDIEQDNFDVKTIKLLSDINLNHGSVVADGIKNIFYPIGYSNNKDNIYDRDDLDGEVDGVVSEAQPFKGTFDGNGHTISNIYQNTWDMFGDYNDGYPANSNYYKDAMGLFAWVDGTVKNLTVDNFESDGEFTPTGVISAYAAFNGDATFENIAITNCNPRVYNTGNGGIVGIAGNADQEHTLNLKNITVDNSNKITALWGSWDVACGGLVGMFRGKPTDNAVVFMKNCHVAAQIDVYNDVCGNYQYYWYRYAGMLIGTNKNMVTDDKGYTVPKTSQYSAEDCTVHFGDWNDYYYCELVENSLASYTHDHQFSRLTEIKNVSEIKDGENWTTTGNFYTKEGEEVTCYHIRKDANGKLYRHMHTDSEKEMVNGEEVDKEDKICVYLPFNQLFTGYGWGVKHIPVYNGEDFAFVGVTILEREEADSVDKFEVKANASKAYKDGMTISVGKIFAQKADTQGVPVKDENVQVFVSPIGDDSNVTATYTPNADNWEDGTITLSGTGLAEISITDYYFCKTATFTVNVTVLSPADDYLNTLGNWKMFQNMNESYTIPDYDYGEPLNTTKNTNISNVVDSDNPNASLIEDTTYGRTDNTSIKIRSNSGRYTYVKLPELKKYTNYTLTFYYSGLEKYTIPNDSAKRQTLWDQYYLFTPEVSGGEFKVNGKGVLYGAGYYFVCDGSDGKEWKEGATALRTSNPDIVAGKDQWNKVQISFNSYEYKDLYLLFRNQADIPEAGVSDKEQAERWIDDISLVETNSGDNDFETYLTGEHPLYKEAHPTSENDHPTYPEGGKWGIITNNGYVTQGGDGSTKEVANTYNETIYKVDGTQVQQTTHNGRLRTWFNEFGSKLTVNENNEYVISGEKSLQMSPADMAYATGFKTDGAGTYEVSYYVYLDNNTDNAMKFGSAILSTLNIGGIYTTDFYYTDGKERKPAVSAALPTHLNSPYGNSVYNDYTFDKAYNNISKGEWHKITHTFTVGANHEKVYLALYNNTTGENAYIDNIVFKKIS